MARLKYVITGVLAMAVSACTNSGSGNSSNNGQVQPNSVSARAIPNVQVDLILKNSIHRHGEVFSYRDYSGYGHDACSFEMNYGIRMASQWFLPGINAQVVLSAGMQPPVNFRHNHRFGGYYLNNPRGDAHRVSAKLYKLNTLAPVDPAFQCQQIAQTRHSHRFGQIHPDAIQSTILVSTVTSPSTVGPVLVSPFSCGGRVVSNWVDQFRTSIQLPTQGWMSATGGPVTLDGRAALVCVRFGDLDQQVAGALIQPDGRVTQSINTYSLKFAGDEYVGEAPFQFEAVGTNGINQVITPTRNR